MSLPLTKTLDPADFDQLTEELAVVDRHFTKGREQHPMRRWEYAMALRALATWKQGKDYRLPLGIADVGGAGSPLHFMLRDAITIIIDPDPPYDRTLQGYLTDFSNDSPVLQQCVFCSSVLEHVDDLSQFLYHLSCLVAPGGLLFLTVDCRESPDPAVPFEALDDRHFHWMRKRIFTPYYVRHLVWGYGLGVQVGSHTFTLLGEADWEYHGHTVHDYSFMSLALVKRP